MINPRDIDALLKMEPFRPLRFVFTDGTQEVVTHPDNVLLTATSVGIGQHDQRLDPPFADWTKTYALIHPVSVETHNQAAPSEGNGKSAG